MFRFLQVLGTQVNEALSPGSKSDVRLKSAFSAFWEMSGVVLLNPSLPEPQELASRFLPALDKFLVANGINVHENIDVESDPRKHGFVTRVRQLRDRFREEVCAVVNLSKQFSDALSVMLEQQRQVRVVSDDEHRLKATWMHERFSGLLDRMLEATRGTVVQLQKSFLTVYAENSAARAFRTQPVLPYEEDMWRTERQLNPNVSRSKASSKRRTNMVTQSSGTYLEEYDDSDDSDDNIRKRAAPTSSKHQSVAPVPPGMQAVAAVAHKKNTKVASRPGDSRGTIHHGSSDEEGTSSTSAPDHHIKMKKARHEKRGSPSWTEEEASSSDAPMHAPTPPSMVMLSNAAAQASCVNPCPPPMPQMVMFENVEDQFPEFGFVGKMEQDDFAWPDVEEGLFA